jgi:hypothetical protein
MKWLDFLVIQMEYKMKNKFIKILICGLLITLSILSVFTNNLYSKNKQLKVQQNLHNQARQEQTFKVIDKETVINKLNLENSLNCLSGSVNTKSTYSNKDISSDDVGMKWLKTKFAEWNSKDISMESKYDFTFSYSLKDLPVQIKNNTVYINMTNNRLSLTKCELSSIQSSERIGFLQNNFTPQEVNSLNYRNQQLAKNTTMSDEDLRYKALENVKGDIKELLQGVISKDTSIVFTDNSYDVVQQNYIVDITK